MTSRILTISGITQPQSRMITYAMVFLALTVGYFILRGSTWQGSTQLHTVMESVASLLALLVGVLALVRFYSKKNNTFLFIGTGFVGTAFLDGYHAVVTSSFFSDQFPSAPASLIPWSWIASRLFLAVLLWFSWVAWRRESKLGDKGKIGEREVYLIAAGLTVLSFLFFAIFPLPRAYYPEIPFHRPEEFVPALFFLAALVGYLKKGLWKVDAFEHWLVLSLIMGFVGQAVFMSFSGQLFDMEFDAAHLLKKVTYITVLVGLLINICHLFQESEKHKEELEAEVTERKRGEEALANKAEELAQSNKELEQFAYVATHDLQEPVRTVKSYTQLLAKRYQGKLDDEADEFLAYAVDGASRMGILINDLLSYSRIGSEGKNFKPADCDLVLSETLANLRTAIEETSGTVTNDPLPTVMADGSQLGQVFQNLIGNALKYRSEEPPRVHVAARQIDGHWQFSVRDNGIGIDPQYTERIFTIFQRLHTRGEYSGTGIGLAVSKKIVERHGGQIWVESAVGKGSTFYFNIPVKGSEES